MVGMRISVMISVGRSSATRSSASFPSRAVITLYPLKRRVISSSSRMFETSSTTRMGPRALFMRSFYRKGCRAAARGTSTLGTAPPQGISRRIPHPFAQRSEDQVHCQQGGLVLDVQDRVHLDHVHAHEAARLSHHLADQVRLALGETSGHWRADAGSVARVERIHVEGEIDAIGIA